jgi:hypothetical protein
MVTSEGNIDVSNKSSLKRSDKAMHLEGRFILDILHEFANDLGHKALAQLKMIKAQETEKWSDKDLLQPYLEVQSWMNSKGSHQLPISKRDKILHQLADLNKAAKKSIPTDEAQLLHGPIHSTVYTLSGCPPQLVAEIEELKQHVRDAQKMWQNATKKKDASSSVIKTPSKGKSPHKLSTQKEIQYAYADVSCFYAEGPEACRVPMLTALGLVERLKASYAVELCKSSSKPDSFPFHVAFAQLCKIKADANRSRDSIQQQFWDRMTIQTSLIRPMKARMEERFKAEQEQGEEVYGG